MKKQDCFLWMLAAIIVLCVWASLTCCGATYNVSPGQSIQTALNSAAGGDDIVLESGGVWRENIVLPANTSGRVITIRSTGSFSVGTRCRPGDSFATIEATGTTRLLRSVSHSHDYRFIGLELRPTQDSTLCYTLCQFGYKVDDNTQITQVDELPHRIEFSHCYIHGWPTMNSQRGLSFNVVDGTVQDCYFSDWHWEGVESQAMCAWNTPGPLTVRNNYLSAAGVNFIVGGSRSVAGAVPTGITVTRNHFHKALSWCSFHPDFAGRTWTVKNLLEFKAGRDIRVTENVFENSWAQAQHGAAIVITPRPPTGSDIGDVTICDNLFKWAGIVIHATGTPADDLGKIDGTITVRNNLCYDISYGTNGQRGRGSLFILGGNITYGIHAIDARNNTFLHGADLQDQYWYGVNFVGFDGRPFIGQWTFRDNIVSTGGYGQHASGDGIGTTALTTVCTTWLQQDNVILFTRDNLRGSFPSGDVETPVGTTPADVFVDPANWNLVLKPNTPYAGAGCNVEQIETMAESVIRGTDAPPGDVYRVLATWTSGQHETSQEAVWSVDGAVVGTEQLPADVESLEAEMRLAPAQVVSLSVRGVNESGQSGAADASVTVPENPQPPPVPTAPTNLVLTLEKK